MAVQIITDSTSDIPRDIAVKLGIKVVPIYVRFGNKIYRDGVDISSAEFYEMLETSRIHLGTSQPTPEDFENAYRQYTNSADGIISIHISSKISGTYNSATIAKRMMNSNIPIEVIDSGLNSGGLALMAISAARLAKANNSFSKITEELKQSASKVHMFGIFNTMKYLASSGRVSKPIVAAAEFLNVKPLLTFRNGEIIRAGLVRTLSRGLEKITNFVKNNLPVSELMIVHSSVHEQAMELKNHLKDFISEEKISIAELGAGLGVHGGPGVLLTALHKA